MPHVLIAGKLHPAGFARLGSADGVTCDYVEEVSESSYAPLIGEADALVFRTQPLSSATIARASRLKIVSRHGVGYDSVDVAALNSRTIPLCIVGDVNSLSVAEHAMMLILACAKQMIRADRSVRVGRWGWRNRLEAGEISGKRLLIIGYGRSGRHLARMAEGFGMDIRAFDPFLVESGWPDGTVPPAAALADGLAWADVVSVHAPKAGRPILAAEEFARLKPRRRGPQHRLRRGRGRDGVGGGSDGRADRSRRPRRVRRRTAGEGPPAARLRPGRALAAHRRADAGSGRADGGRFRPERHRFLCWSPRPRSHRQQGLLT
jgi:D-3-phosphoglycerate dehydrogenase